MQHSARRPPRRMMTTIAMLQAITMITMIGTLASSAAGRTYATHIQRNR